MSREKDPVKLAYTSPVDITTEGIGAKQGAVVAVDDRILLTDQPNYADNGIYLAKDGAPWVWADDWQDASDMLAGSWVRVLEGDYASRSFVFTNPTPPALVGTSLLNWKQDGIETLADDSGLERVLGKLKIADVLQGVDEGDLTAQKIIANLKGQIVGTEAAFNRQTYFQGGQVIFWNTNTVEVQSGEAYLLDPDGVVSWAETQVTIPLTAGTLQHVYVYDDGEGNGLFEVDDNYPVSPVQELLWGTSHFVKGSDTPGEYDTSRRYVFSVRVNAAGTRILEFYHDVQTGLVRWTEDTAATPLRVVNGSASQSVNLLHLDNQGSNLVPPQTFLIYMRIRCNNNSGVSLAAYGDGWSRTNPPTTGYENLTAGADARTIMLLGESGGSFIYANLAASGSTIMDLLGYYLRR